MPEQTDQVTVYRSMDPSAEEECNAVVEELATHGISAVLFDDSAPGVPEGTYEVRVPATEGAKAEALLAVDSAVEKASVETDESHDLDLETVFSSQGGTSTEVEAVSIQSVLEANGIRTVMVGDAVLPNFGLEVRVAREDVPRARAILADALKQGSVAAEEAERQSEAS